MYRKIKEKEEKFSDNYVMTKYRELRGMYEINVIRNRMTGLTAVQFSNFTDLNINIKFDDVEDPLGKLDITFGNVEFPNRVDVDELAIIGEEFVKIHEFISSVRRDFIHNQSK